jgi:hypothetical protein
MENGNSGLLSAEDNAGLYKAQFLDACSYLASSGLGLQNRGSDEATCALWSNGVMLSGINTLVQDYTANALLMIDRRARARVYNECVCARARARASAVCATAHVHGLAPRSTRAWRHLTRFSRCPSIYVPGPTSSNMLQLGHWLYHRRGGLQLQLQHLRPPPGAVQPI